MIMNKKNLSFPFVLILDKNYRLLCCTIGKKKNAHFSLNYTEINIQLDWNFDF